MATQEDQTALRTLVQHVARAFYEPKFVVVLDQLSRHPVLKDDDLAGRMGLQAKELNKLMAVLLNDRLIRVYRQNELKEGAQRSVGKQYYYVDYEHLCNVVKWRITEMHRIIDNSLRNELDQKGYVCPQCSKSFTPLDAAKLMDFTVGAFLCDDCHAELVDNENAASVVGSRDRMQRFNAQMRHVREGLRKSEAMLLPHFDVAAWVAQHSRARVEAADAGAGAGPELKIAGAGGARRADEGVGVVLSMDGADEATKRRQRDAQAAARQQQNALPAWHLKSTITGDLTALGVKESARAAALAEQQAASSNDEILRGLGTVRREERAPAPVVEDIKPVITHGNSDYYDQYYAQLAAGASSSSGGTPAVPGLGSDFGDEDDEDVKPNVEYLNSLNDYRKRSRSREDEGGPGSQKKLRESSADDDDDDMEGVPHANGLPPKEDPIVHVNGAPMPLSQVTEEHHELMTPEEYTAYFEALEQQGQ